ncbi:MAG: hypothetical protein L0241_00875 [Planctomycetia bacterium]|nr:hypothetical protein [Planctomycetia bacterium]
MRTFLIALLAGSALAAGVFLIPSTAAEPSKPEPAPVPVTPASTSLVAHEWGTFTSFSGSDGVPANFAPNNVDLPSFVYYPYDQTQKIGRLLRDGLVSMETPVIYFYTDKEMRVSVKVDFPRGWITEWYPYAAGPPIRTDRNDKVGGQTIRWDVKLTPNEPARFRRDKGDNHYYHARETDAVPLQVNAIGDKRRAGERPGGAIVQREKFLFYRGVGTFPPPVIVRALGSDKVRITNNAGGQLDGLVLVTVRDGKIGFRPVGELNSGSTMDALLPEMGGKRAELADFLVKELTAAGLYEKEAKAMVKTWDAAWFGEEGTRLLYLVPRKKTDELLPLTVDPKPKEVVRVLVGRHDFLTPEQEVVAEKIVLRLRAGQIDEKSAKKEFAKLGRFGPQAQQLAVKRLATTPNGRP